jgi:hypothetical protein
MKEYRIVGDNGQWGEVLPARWLDSLFRDKEFAEEHHPTHSFHLEVRDVTDWSEVDEVEEADLRREVGEDR